MNTQWYDDRNAISNHVFTFVPAHHFQHRAIVVCRGTKLMITNYILFKHRQNYMNCSLHSQPYCNKFDNFLRLYFVHKCTGWRLIVIYRNYTVIERSSLRYLNSYGVFFLNPAWSVVFLTDDSGRLLLPNLPNCILRKTTLQHT